MTDYKELGAIAACVKHVRGVAPFVPFPKDSIAAKQWQRGFDEETKKIAEESKKPCPKCGHRSGKVKCPECGAPEYGESS